MNPEHWQRIEALYYEALDLPFDQRAAFLTPACADNDELRREVESLLAAHENAAAFLGKPVIDDAAQRLALRLGLEDRSTAQLPTAALPPGQLINQYRILSHLGAGGMGEVYLAEDTRLHRKVALKLLPAQFAQNADRVRRFEQEARAVSALNHPNIVTLFDLGHADEQYFMTTEYIDGQTLRACLLERGRLPVKETLEITAQIASALAAAHAAGIVHRDIKPDNVMLRLDGYVKVLDFGLAKVNEPPPLANDDQAEAILSSITDAGVVMGTVSYMSPEQARGLRVDARTDIFSLGVMLYEMLTGQRPFTGSTASDIIASILRSDPLPLDAALADAPAELQTLIAKTLAKERDERFQSVSDFARELKQLSQEMEFQARLADSGNRRTGKTAAAAAAQPAAPATVTTGPRFRTKRNTLIFAAALGLLLLALGLGQLGKLRNVTGTKPAKPSPAGVKTLAVLPFKFIGSTREDESLSYVLTDATILKLSSLHQLIVRPTQSVMQFQHSTAKLLEIARALKADAVVTGTVQKLGEEIRLTVQFVPTTPDIEVEQAKWTGTFHSRAGDLLALQDELSMQLAGALSLQLTGQERQRLQNRYTDNAQAYQLYLRARLALDQKSPEGLERAGELLNQALALDNRYALAYVQLAMLWLMRVDHGVSSKSEGAARCEAAARQAVALDDGLADAHSLLANVKFIYHFDPAAAEREHRRALELDPYQPMVRQWYSLYLLGRGRVTEGLDELRRALELDPLSAFVRSQLARALYLSGHYAEAMAVCRELLQMDPNHGSAYLFLGLASDLTGDFDAALPLLLKAKSLNPSPERIAALGHLYARMGRRAEALQALAEEDKFGANSDHYYKANIHAALGDTEAAFNALEQAYQARNVTLIVRLKLDPQLASLHADPRFNDLLRRVGLPTETRGTQ